MKSLGCSYSRSDASRRSAISSSASERSSLENMNGLLERPVLLTGTPDPYKVVTRGISGNDDADDRGSAEC